MKNTPYYNRLENLFSLLGASVTQGTTDSAELIACCKGIDMVTKQFDTIMSDIMLYDINGKGAVMLCDLLQINPSLSDDERRQRIINRLSEHLGDYGGEAGEVLAKIDPDLSFTTEPFILKISGVNARNKATLYRIGKFLKNYHFPILDVDFGGDGMDFDFWDKNLFTFREYDGLDMTFDNLETLK